MKKVHLPNLNDKKNQNALVLNEVLTFSIQSSSHCQSISQYHQSLLLISYSSLICDVILAIDLEKVPVFWQTFCPLRLSPNLKWT